MDGIALYAEAKKLYDAGQTLEAVAKFEAARSAFADQGDAVNTAQVTNDLGVVYYLTGKRDEAQKLLSEAFALFEKHGNVLGQAKAIGNLAQLMNRGGDKDGAVQNYQRAAELFHQAGETTFEFDTYRALSQMELQRGRWLQALAMYDRALAAKGGSKFLRWFLQIPLKLVGMR